MMTWHRPGDKPLSEPMMFCLQSHICVTRPQWVLGIPRTIGGGGGGGGGLLGRKNSWGVPQAAENWILKDRGKNGIWDQKYLILDGLVPKKILLVLVDEKKYPKKIVFNTQKVKKGGQNGSTYIYHPT